MELTVAQCYHKSVVQSAYDLHACVQWPQLMCIGAKPVQRKLMCVKQ